LKQAQIKKLHNGLIKCPISKVGKWMPEIFDIVEECVLPHEDYFVDAKVHMLMPGQFPCIPNWHGDAIPRDADGQLLLDDCDDSQRLFLWLSGPPLTEFQDGRKIESGEWVEFGQRDIHRGVASDDFQWRLFLRLMPHALTVRPRIGESCLRRHSQVYLDSAGFQW
jgi:hypothetical protein